jgi:RNA polymerase-binding transcription factor DksA
MMVLHDKLKKQLKDEHKRLKAQLAARPVNDRGGMGYSTHQADDATEAFEQAKSLAIRQNSERLLAQVENALARFEDGTFGLCIHCCCPIDPARLEAIPYTSSCLECQSKQEHK